ncbi:hypothetical protein M8396_14620, partial [Staphylococcus aureus]
RFGSTNEMGIFEMKQSGLKGVNNPSEMFLEDRSTNVPGSTIVERSSKNISDGLFTPFNPLCFISKIPISFVEPKRFLTARKIR